VTENLGKLLNCAECSHWMAGCTHGIYSQFQNPQEACERWKKYESNARRHSGYGHTERKKKMKQQKLQEIGK